MLVSGLVCRQGAPRERPGSAEGASRERRGSVQANMSQPSFLNQPVEEGARAQRELERSSQGKKRASRECPGSVLKGAPKERRGRSSKEEEGASRPREEEGVKSRKERKEETASLPRKEEGASLPRQDEEASPTIPPQGR